MCSSDIWAYPSLWTPAGYRCRGPGTSAPAVEPPPGTPLKHMRQRVNREPIREQWVMMWQCRWVTLSGQVLRWDALHGQRARWPHQSLLRHHLHKNRQKWLPAWCRHWLPVLCHWLHLKRLVLWLTLYVNVMQTCWGVRIELQTHWPWSTSHAAPWRWLWPERCSETRDTSAHSCPYPPPQRQSPWTQHTHTHTLWAGGPVIMWSADDINKWPWHIQKELVWVWNSGCEMSVCACVHACVSAWLGAGVYLSLPRWGVWEGGVLKKERERETVLVRRAGHLSMPRHHTEWVLPVFSRAWRKDGKQVEMLVCASFLTSQCDTNTKNWSHWAF